MNKKRQKLLHHIAAAVGFTGLIAWFYTGLQLGILDWITLKFPEKYHGGGYMLAIMIVMTPGFFIWSRYNRWVERSLDISGIYYETEYEEEQEQLRQEKMARKNNLEQSDKND